MIHISTFSAFIKSSSLLCILGLAVASVLLQEQQRLVGANSTSPVSIVTPFHSMFAANFEVRQAVHLVDRNTNHVFQSTAIAHSLPQALFAWALFLLAMEGFWMTFADLPLPIVSTFFPVVAILVVACVGIWKAVHPRQKVFKDPVLSAP